MNALDVRQQVRLPLSKCVELVLSGVRFRLFRAAITVVIIALAVAFLMTILAEGTTAREVSVAIERQTAPRRLFLLWVSRLATPMKEKDLTEELYRLDDTLRRSQAKGSHVDAATVALTHRRLDELKTWGKLSDAELDQLTDVARRQIDPRTGVMTYFETLTEGLLRPLVGSVRGSDIIVTLADPEKYKHCEVEATRIGKKLPEGLKQFVADWHRTIPLRQKVLKGHADAVLQAAVLFNNNPPRLALATADDSLPAKLAPLGFMMTGEELQTVRVQAALARDADTIAQKLGSSYLKAMLASRCEEKAGSVNAQMLYQQTATADGAQWLVQQTDAARGYKPQNLSDRQIRDLALTQVPLTQAQLTVDLAAAVMGEISWTSLAEWGGKMDDSVVRRLVNVARWQEGYDTFFGNLNPKDRLELLGEENPNDPYASIETTEGFDRMAKILERNKRVMEKTVAAMEWMKKELADDIADDKDPQAKARHQALLKEVQSGTVTELAVFRYFMDVYSRTKPPRMRIIQGRQNALDKVRQALHIEEIAQVRHGLAMAIYALFEIDTTEPGELRALWQSQLAQLRADRANLGSAATPQTGVVDMMIRSRQGLIEALDKAGPQDLRGQLHQQSDDLAARLRTLEAAMVKAVDEDKDLKPAVIHALAQRTAAAQEIASLLTVPLVRQQAALRLRLKPHERWMVNETELFKEISSEQGAVWFDEEIGKIAGLSPMGLSVQRVAEVSQDRLEQTHLSELEATVGQAASASSDELFAGFSARTLWLIVVSFIVCIVGIANAMLMSVTERFREIATMKCLGATDGFIMVNFVLESCLQGVVGGLIGAALGLLLGMVRAAGSYGMMALEHLPWGQMFQMAGVSMVVGLGISALAAVYPAWAAARLAPMEAMRIE
ncbi:MAG: FtsX-like permease family protein [Planctomycetaceae bacterium]|nr:ABC transporter permease [Planctomycetaceae bacterium]